MTEWWERGACVGDHPQLWVPNSEEPAVPELLARKCRGCDVRNDCLIEAIATRSVGYWAGTTSEERRRMEDSVTPVRAQCSWCERWFTRRSTAHRTCSKECRGHDKRAKDRERARRNRGAS